MAEQHQDRCEQNDPKVTLRVDFEPDANGTVLTAVCRYLLERARKRLERAEPHRNERVA
jgi:hypothetical protein